MSARPSKRRLSVADMEVILAVAGKLAAPFDLKTMMSEVVSAATQVLHAHRGSVWLYDPATDQMVLEIATGIAAVRVPAGAGVVGACARDRRIINVPDCYSDPRFNPEVDRISGYRTRCMLALPLVDHKDVLVGVMQLLNKADGVFDENDRLVGCGLLGHRRHVPQTRNVERPRIVTVPCLTTLLPGSPRTGSWSPPRRWGKTSCAASSPAE